jgi:DNA processing protein
MRSSDVAIDFDLPASPKEDREAIELAVCNLLAVPGLTGPRARRLIQEFSPTGAYDALCDGGLPTIDAFDNEPTVHKTIAAARRSTGLGAMYFDRCRRLSIHLWLPGDPGWADHFANDGQAPAALFYRGHLGLCTRPRVAIVGTRSATPAGREMAQRFGRELSDLGIAIVSGLAFGIDANAHAGALASEDAAPIGVVGSGLDVIYPRANAELWKRVTDRGVMFSEYLPGSRPTQFSFPDRNRIIAGLCDVLVVVESTESGGSMLTVNDAWVRKKPVMAVPGNPLHKSCAGSNGLLRRAFADDKRVIPCVDTADILSVLALDRLVTNSVVESRREPDEIGMEVLLELGWEGASTSKLVLRLGRPAGEVVGALGRLELDGWISCRAGQWSQVPAGVRR